MRVRQFPCYSDTVGVRATRQRVTSPRKKPAQARAQATVDAILSAAARIFETHGYRAGTTNRIAERAGVSIGSLYEYFPGKDAILIALARRHMGEGLVIVRTMLGAAGPTDAVPDFLEQVVRAMVVLHEKEPRLHRVLFEETPLPATLRRELAESEAALVTIVGNLLALRSDVRTSDPTLTAWFIVHLVESMTHRFVLYPPASCDADRFVAEAVRLLSRYLVVAGD
jgi:AcrR family transcriptional regulator